MEVTFWFTGPLGARIYATMNTDEAEAVLSDIGDRMNDLRPAYRSIANWMRKSFARNFFEGGRPDRWKPLSPNTLAAKEGNPAVTYNDPIKRIRVRRLTQLNRLGVPMRSFANILIANGALRDSAAQKNKDHVELISHGGLEIGSKHWLAAIHQEGTDPYMIRPKRGRFLRFVMAGGPAVARSVRHPGVPARPFILAQDEDVENAAKEVLAHVVGSPDGN